MKAFEILIAVIGGVAFLVSLSLLLSLPVYFLWNECLVGAIDGVKQVTWLQAWGLMILSSFLFKTTVSTKKD
jgi:hypothetical protein